MKKTKVVCIGGGHGLGHLLDILSSIEHVDITGIVATTDNGGSTGRLRQSGDTIAWGDIRYCLSKLAVNTSIQSLLFEHRFEQLGDLTGHSLGNLMFCAIDSLCLRPTDTVKVMAKFLEINANILPMSDAPTNLVSEVNNEHKFFGEVAVDCNINSGLTKLSLEPKVKASQEVIDALSQADVLLLGPGSFFTSTLPPLLIADVVTAVNSNKTLQSFLMTNVKREFNNDCDTVKFQLDFLNRIGIDKHIKAIVPQHLKNEITHQDDSVYIADLPADDSGRHQYVPLLDFLRSYLIE